jgi:hypothetical protein
VLENIKLAKLEKKPTKTKTNQPTNQKTTPSTSNFMHL